MFARSFINVFRPTTLRLGLFSLLAASGCSRAYTVNMGAQPSATAHYVVVKTKWTGSMRVFDCQSRPDGTTWEPTCRQVKMQSAMGQTFDDTLTRIRDRKDAK
jgi:hypothetical protein